MGLSWKDFNDVYGPVVDGHELPPEAAYTDGRSLIAVCTLARASKGVHLLEIGTAFGHTAVALARVCPNARVSTIGTCRELAGKTTSRFDREILSRERQGSFIRAQSAELRDRIHGFVGRPVKRQSLLRSVNLDPFQFVYIDGDHSWRSVVEDTRTVLTEIDPNGTIVWDDYLVQCPEVHGFVEILKKGNPIAVIDHTKTAFVKLTAELRLRLLVALEDL